MFKMFLFLALEISVIVFVASILVGGTWMLVAPRLQRIIMRLNSLYHKLHVTYGS